MLSSPQFFKYWIFFFFLRESRQRTLSFTSIWHEFKNSLKKTHYNKWWCLHWNSFLTFITRTHLHFSRIYNARIRECQSETEWSNFTFEKKYATLWYLHETKATFTLQQNMVVSILRTRFSENLHCVNRTGLDN